MIYIQKNQIVHQAFQTFDATTVLHRAPKEMTTPPDECPSKGEKPKSIFGDIRRNVQDVLATSNKQTLACFPDDHMMTVGEFKRLTGVQIQVNNPIQPVIGVGLSN